MKIRIIAFILAFCLCLGPGASAAGSAASGGYSGYSDVPEGHWSAESVRRATELGLFQGVGDGKFGRGQPITRAAFVTALVRLFGWESVTPAENAFTDVTSDRWFYSAVETAYQHEAVVAPGRAFRPTENITREEMAVMLVRALGYASLAGAVSSYPSTFTDVKVSRGFITIACDLGIMTGVDTGKFAPDATATREQAAAVLVRAYDRIHAQSKAVSSASAESSILIRIATPAANEKTEIPTTPLEPIAELYAALRKLKDSGGDVRRAVLCLNGGGVRTLVSGGKIVESTPISAAEVEKLLVGGGVRTYYSARYESAYCIYAPNEYQTATVWYQSSESLAAKLQLARLFGVTKYMLQ